MSEFRNWISILVAKLGIQFRNYQFLVPFPRDSILYKNYVLKKRVKTFKEILEKKVLKGRISELDLNFGCLLKE